MIADPWGGAVQLSNAPDARLLRTEDRVLRRLGTTPHTSVAVLAAGLELDELAVTVAAASMAAKRLARVRGDVVTLTVDREWLRAALLDWLG